MAIYGFVRQYAAGYGEITITTDYFAITIVTNQITFPTFLSIEESIVGKELYKWNFNKEKNYKTLSLMFAEDYVYDLEFEEDCDAINDVQIIVEPLSFF